MLPAPSVATAPRPQRPAPAGLHRPSKRSASPASAASSELPIAISTLRMKRSRPMRLTGDFVNSARNAASSSRARSASCRCAQFGARGEFRFASGLRELVPRARPRDNRRSHRCGCRCFAEFVRDRALVLDREIGDAAPRIELVGRRERCGRADVLAGGAGAAMIGVGRIARQIGRSKDRAEKQPGAELARDEIGVLALPAQSRRLRQRLLHHGGGIDEHFDLAARRSHQPSRQRLQPLLDEVMIIVALRIDRDRAARALLAASQADFHRARN